MNCRWKLVKAYNATIETIANKKEKQIYGSEIVFNINERIIFKTSYVISNESSML